MDTNFFAVSAMSLLTVAAAVPAAKVIHAGDTPASTLSNYGRGLGRPLGVGVTLGAGVEVAGAVAVALGVGFGVAVGVAVGLGVGVGLGAAGTIAYA